MFIWNDYMKIDYKWFKTNNWLHYYKLALIVEGVGVVYFETEEVSSWSVKKREHTSPGYVWVPFVGVVPYPYCSN